MRRLLALLFASMVAFTGDAAVKVLAIKHTAAAAFCAGTFAFCDDFSSASDPPTNWTEVNATTWINTGTVLNSPTSGSPSILHVTADLGSTTQYAIVKFVNNAIGDMGIALHNGAESSVDVVYYGGGKMWWGLVANSASFIQDVAECTYTPVAGDYLTAQVTGTGATRVMELWVSTTAPTGAPSGTATCTWTAGTGASHTSPATASACVQTLCVPAADTTGLKAGVWINGIDSGKVFDNFAAGP